MNRQTPKFPLRKGLPWRWGCLVFLGIALVLELFVFNAQFFIQYAVRGGEEKVYTAADMKLGDGIELVDAENNLYRAKKGDYTIELLKVNTAVRSVYVEIERVDGLPISFAPAMRDASSNYYDTSFGNFFRNFPSFAVDPDLEKSKYVVIHAAETVKSMRLFVGVPYKSYLNVRQVIVNKHRPLFFSWVRLLFVFGVLCACKLLRPRSKIWDVWVDDTRKQRWITAGVCVALCLSMFALVTQLDSNPIERSLQYSKLAVRLLNGQVSLPDEPDPVLVAMKNPYDTRAREENKVENLFDHAFYKGKYYVYFGVVPVVLFYVPYHLLTGGDLNNTYVSTILLFGCVFLWFALLRELTRRWFPKISYVLYLLLGVAGFCALGTWVLAGGAPTIYAVPVATALALILGGWVLWLRAFRLAEETKPLSPLLLGCGALCFALVAGCRPQLLLCMIPVVPMLLQFFIKPRRFSVVRFGVLALPFAVVAGGLMVYNQLRFGSPTDFGANYNLTVNDMTHRGFSLVRIPSGIWTFLFQPAKLDPTAFPFVKAVDFQSSALIRAVREYTRGGIFNTPLFWSLPLLFVPEVRDFFKKARLQPLIWSCLGCGLLICVVDVQVAGIVPRYWADFSLLFAIPAVLAVLHWFPNTAKTRLFVSLAAVVTIGYNILQVLDLNFAATWDMNRCHQNIYGLIRLMEWWK